MKSCTLNKLNDKELLEAIAGKDKDAFGTFYRKYRDFVFRRIHYRLRSREEAEDLVQEFWSSLWERPVTIHTDSAVYFLIHLILVCLSRYYRSKNPLRTSKTFTFENPGKELKELQYTHVFEDLEAEELFILIEETQNLLPENERLVYELCQKQHYSFSEAAVLLETTEQTVRNRFNHSCQIIRMQLKQHYSFEPETPNPSLKVS